MARLARESTPASPTWAMRTCLSSAVPEAAEIAARASSTAAVIVGSSMTGTSGVEADSGTGVAFIRGLEGAGDRKSTRLNSSHVAISYAVFCLKKKKGGARMEAGHTQES